MDHTIKIGGQAGQGLQTIGAVLAKLFARSGFHVFTHQDYMSRIRGGHNFYQVRFADHEISASRKIVDILVALDKNTVAEHLGELSPVGLVVYDPKQSGKSTMVKTSIFRSGGSPWMRAGNRIMENTVAVGAVLGMLAWTWIPLKSCSLRLLPERAAKWWTRTWPPQSWSRLRAGN